MVPLLLLLLTALAVLLLVRQRRRQLRARPAPAAERHLFNLRIGDIVQADGRDWVVEDRLLYEQPGGFQWLEYRLQDGEDRRWLSVSEDDEVEVGWLRAADPAEIEGAGGLRGGVPERLVWDGREHRLRERGTAWLRAEARTLNRRAVSCAFADYDGPDGGLLSVEWWGAGCADPDSEIEITAGRRIDPAGLALLPGDGRPVYRSAALPG